MGHTSREVLLQIGLPITTINGMNQQGKLGRNAEGTTVLLRINILNPHVGAHGMRPDWADAVRPYLTGLFIAW